MFNFKKITALLCAFAMMAVVSGCSSDGENSSASDSSSDENSVSDGNLSLDTTASLGSMNYCYNSGWMKEDNGSQISFQLTDNSGALILQLTDGASMDAENEDDVVEQLADQSEAAWSSIEGMEILESSWNEELISGKKCYVIEYSYEISSIVTTNTSIFFANFTDKSKDLFAITASEINELSTVDLSLEALLETISFSE